MNLYNLNLFVFFILIIRGLVCGTSSAFDNTNDTIMRVLLITNALYNFAVDFKLSFRGILITLYLIAYSFFSLNFGNSIYDTINAQLYLIYTVIFLQIINARKASTVMLYIGGLKGFVWLVFVVYSVMVLMGIRRPFIMVENNFELMLVGLGAYTISVNDGKSAYLWIFLIIAIISGSKSAFLVSSFLLGRSIFPSFLAMLIFGGVSSFVYLLFFEIDVEQIDRFTFLFVFLEELGARSLSRLFISGFLSPLSFTQGLEFYTGSLSNSEVYYPKVLHSWWLSASLNHGFAAVALYLFFIFGRLKKVAGSIAIDVMIVVGINSLSVSGFDSIWFWFSLLIFLPLWKRDLNQC